MSQPRTLRNGVLVFLLTALMGYCAIFAYQTWSHFQVYVDPRKDISEKAYLAIQPISSSLDGLLSMGLIILAVIALWYAACKRWYPNPVETIVAPSDADIDIQIKVAQLNYLSSLHGTEADRVFAAGMFGCTLGVAMYVMQMLLNVAPGAWIALHLAG